jgi:acyl-coenzyme A synthetase/AMP-(fatty) acid ligase
VEYLQNGPDDVILSVLQLNFSYGILQLLATVRTQATLVLENGFGYPYEVVKQFGKYGVTGFAGAPTIWAMLLQLKDITPGEFATVRYITNAAAAMPAPFVPRLADLFTNAHIYLMHGMTECFRTAYLSPEEALVNPTSIGRPMRNVDLWLEDENGRRVEAGGAGELVIAGPTLMAGYWNDPEGTEQMMRPHRGAAGLALHSGDLFRTDERGYFYFVARKDDIIKSRGEKVSPVEVEAVIYQLPEVRECRVIGVPDDVLGHRLRAEIILREGMTLEDKQVKAQCIRHLEPFKVPQDVVFVTELPKTAGGKIVRGKGDVRH